MTTILRTWNVFGRDNDCYGHRSPGGALSHLFFLSISNDVNVKARKMTKKRHGCCPLHYKEGDFFYKEGELTHS